MEVDQTQSFNQKLSQWIASQGFWFQLRHSMSGGGGWAMTLSHLMRLGFKILIALAVGAGGFGVYLVKRVDSKPFREALDVGLEKGLGASEAKIVDFTRMQGDAQIRRLGAEGGDSCFFRSLDAGNVHFRMGLLDGLAGKWDAGTLIAKWMEMDLKAGANSPEEATSIGQSLFREWPGFRFSSLEVDEATLRWGYHSVLPQKGMDTRGRIERSHMVATRLPDGWQLVFTGGTFSQNWLKNLEIKELKMELNPGELIVKSGVFKCGTGDVTFSNVVVKGGYKPTLSGKITLSKVELAQLLPHTVEPFLEGFISTDLNISGSTNGGGGIQMEGDVTLGGGNLISLRERFHLLKALSVVDVYNSYRKVDLDRGSFHMKTGGGILELSRVDLKADELMTVQGRLQVRPPDEKELAGTVGTNVPNSFSPVFNSSPEQDPSKAKPDLSLQKAATGGEASEKDMAIFGRRAQERIEEQFAQDAVARESQMLRYDGGFRITIPGDAFDRAEVLRNAFPVDPGNGRIPLDVPVQGTVFDLSRRQAEELLELGTKH